MLGNHSPFAFYLSLLNFLALLILCDTGFADLVEDKSSSVDVGKGGVNVDAGQGKPGGGTNVGVGKGGVSVNTGHKGKPVYVGVTPGPSPFTYKYAATEDQLHADPSVALFFMEKDMRLPTSWERDFILSWNQRF